MADSHYDAPTRIQELLEYLHEREVDLETLADSKRNRLEQCVQLRNFENEARQVSTASLCFSYSNFMSYTLRKRGLNPLPHNAAF